MNQNEDLNQGDATTVNQALGVLASKKQEWAAMDAAGRLGFLQKMLARLQAVDHEGWGKAAAVAYGFSPDHPAGDYEVAMESMVNAGVCIGSVQHLIRTVQSQATTGTAPELKRERQDGREIVQVFPVDRADKFTPEGMSGCTGEVWLNAELESARENASAEGSVCLVLGAGNQSFLAFGDVLYQLFVEGSVCLLKHHPLRDFSAQYFNEIFADLIDAGFFAACQVDLEETHTLLHSPLVDRVHMTGGTKTHDAIVWGKSPELQQQNKAAGTPVLNKPMSSELGCVTPWIVVPGTEWTDKEIGHMAGHLVAAFVAQNSCNCLSPKLVVLDKDWPQYAQFIEAVRVRLQNTPTPPPHYPGAADRYRGFAEAYPVAQLEMIPSPGHRGMSEHDLGACLPWLLVHLDKESDTYALQNEAFSPVLAIYTVSTNNDADSFVNTAVPFVNETVWGSLSCTLIAHPFVDAETVEQAISELRYGSVGVNTWTATMYATSGMTWGAYPGDDLANVASGRGIVRNSYALRGVEKSVFRCPFQSTSQLVIGRNGTHGRTAAQFRAIRQMFVRPGLRSMLGMFRELATPDPEDGLQVGVGQRGFVLMLTAAEKVFGWVDRLFGR